MTPADKERIDAMCHREMALMMRYSSLLQFPWNDEDAAKYFMDRWNTFAGASSDKSDSD